MNEEDKRDNVEKLNDSLYSPNAPEVNKILRRGITVENKDPLASKVPKEWGMNRGDEQGGKILGWTKKEQPIFKKILWFALGFFILCAALATFWYLKGVNTVSVDKIDIDLSGPLAVAASNPFALDIALSNHNNSDLVDTDLLIDYPEGSRMINDNTKPVVEDLVPVGNIKKEELVRKRSEVILFGQEGEKKYINVTFHYHVPGSSSVFEKKAIYEVIINSAPVTVSVDGVKELNSNQEISFDVRVTSNSMNVLKNIGVKPNFPFGFTYRTSDPAFDGPQTTKDTSLWIIPELQPAETKEFKVTGTLKGEKDEQKYFKFEVGSIDPFNPERILSSFVTVDRLVAIKLPFISSEIQIGNATDASVKAGQTARVNITYRNNLPTPVTDLDLSLKLTDNNLIDQKRIVTNEGFYSSLNDTVTWNKTTAKDLASVGPGQGGQVSVFLPFLNPSSDALKTGSLKNLMINLDLTLKGKRLSDDNVPEEIVSLDSRTIRVGTNVNLTSSITYNSGPFKNTGGIPPQVDKPTTYTVTWKLSSTLNEVTNGVVTATLPPYVTFEGSIAPLGEKFTYDKTANTVKWEIDKLFAGQGYKNNPRQISFKITFIPSANQTGSSPVLIRDTVFKGLDTFTGEPVEDSADNQSTAITTDPNFVYGQDKVKK